MENKKELEELLTEYINMSIVDKTNHWIRRFYRCFIDGSYEHYNSGEAGYNNNITFIRSLNNLTDKKKYITLKTKVASYFVDFLTIEFPTLSRSVIQSIIKKIFQDKIETFYQFLMDDFCELDEKNLTDFFSSELLKSKK